MSNILISIVTSIVSAIIGAIVGVLIQKLLIPYDKPHTNTESNSIKHEVNLSFNNIHSEQNRIITKKEVIIKEKKSIQSPQMIQMASLL